MLNLLLLGLLLGLRHALEADHVAAVASLSSRKQSLSHSIRQGVAWGIGHTITLFVFGAIVIFMDTVIPGYLAKKLELAVGIMLIVLGGDVLRRVIRNKVHFHSHQHENGGAHFHAHSHAGQRLSRHQELKHDHQHSQAFPVRALMVGLMHGMAGSAAVILLTFDAGTSALQGMLYILLFGIGSMLGMALLSVAITLPMRLFAKQLTWAHNSFQVLVGCLTIGIGVLMLFENSISLSI
ncbi:MAG: urease accessory protein [Proteobacteria bacterium]|nr:urease accessory protein [Pseudomonadota bacterium]